MPKKPGSNRFNIPIFQYAFKCKECLLIHHHNAEGSARRSSRTLLPLPALPGYPKKRAGLTSLLLILIIVSKSRKTHPLPLPQSRPSETADAAPSGVVSALRVVEALIMV